MGFLAEEAGILEPRYDGRLPQTAQQEKQAQSIDRLMNKLESIQNLVEVRVQVNNRPANQADVRMPANDPKSTALMN